MIAKYDTKAIAVSVAKIANQQFDYGATFGIHWVIKKAGLAAPYGSLEEFFIDFTKISRFLNYFYEEMLEKYKKQIRSIGGWQLMVVRRDNQVEHNMRCFKKGFRAIVGKTHKGLTHVCLDGFSAQQKKERTEALLKIGAIRSFVERSYQLEKQARVAPQARARKAARSARKRLESYREQAE